LRHPQLGGHPAPGTEELTMIDHDTSKISRNMVAQINSSPQIDETDFKKIAMMEEKLHFPKFADDNLAVSSKFIPSHALHCKRSSLTDYD
jgi:hypothetical protein